MNDFNMEDVKELVFGQVLAAYQEKKGMMNYIKQLEEENKALKEKSENLEPSA